MESNKTLIGVTTGEYARRADFYDYYNMLHKPANTLHLLCHDRSPAHGRNLIIQTALDNDCTHVLMVDDDQSYPSDALMRLLAHDVDIVSGLYLSRAYPHIPMVFDVANEEGACFPIYLMDGMKGLVPIVASGLGFLLMKTSIFAKLEKPYVRLGELNSEEWCDDMGFFKRVREAGIQSYCDLDCYIGHMGSMIVKPERLPNGKWVTGYDTNGSGIIQTPQIAPNSYAFQEQ